MRVRRGVAALHAHLAGSPTCCPQSPSFSRAGCEGCRAPSAAYAYHVDDALEAAETERYVDEVDALIAPEDAVVLVSTLGSVAHARHAAHHAGMLPLMGCR